MTPPLALYVHIPFCETRCPYCDFNTYAGIEPLMPAYVDALAREIGEWGAWLGRPALTSVFFGGGTPSYLPTRDLTRLMRAIGAAFRLPKEAEATMEANPGDCAPERPPSTSNRYSPRASATRNVPEASVLTFLCIAFGLPA